MTYQEAENFVNSLIAEQKLVGYSTATEFIEYLRKNGYPDITADEIVYRSELLSQSYKREKKAYKTIVGIANPVDAFWKKVQQFFKTMFENVWSGFIGVFPSLWGNLIKVIKKLVIDDPYKDWENWLEEIMQLGLVDENDIKQFKNMLPGHPELRWLGQAMTTLSILSNWVGLTTESASGTMRKTMFSKYSPNTPDPLTILNCAFVAPEKIKDVEKVLRESGLSKEDIDLLYLSNYRMYSEGMIRDLFLRKIISQDEVFVQMRKLGYTDSRTTNIMKTWYVIPPPGDLFTLVAHEAFEPAAIQKLGLMEEFPESQVESLEAQGVTREWAEKYWVAHWMQPSIGQGYEMFHRGEIDENILNELFKTVEIPPFWREKLTNIAYNPITRVDVRRMYEMGVLTEDDVYRSYLDLGYKPTNAEKMTIWTMLEAQVTQKDLTKSEILNAYEDKNMKKKDAIESLKKIGYDENEASFLIAQIDLIEAKKLLQEDIDYLRDNYINYYNDRKTTVLALNRLGITAEQLGRYMREWDYKRKSSFKRLTKNDLNTLFLEDIINEETLANQLSSLGYEEMAVSWLVGLAKKKKGK